VQSARRTATDHPWYNQAAIHEGVIAVQVLPEEVLADREGLAACLTEQLHALARRKADELEILLKANGG
jgi:hypothetical protein